jgi:hypothetical protein
VIYTSREKTLLTDDLCVGTRQELLQLVVEYLLEFSRLFVEVGTKSSGGFSHEKHTAAQPRIAEDTRNVAATNCIKVGN